jgi:hypothetical protein
VLVDGGGQIVEGPHLPADKTVAVFTASWRGRTMEWAVTKASHVLADYFSAMLGPGTGARDIRRLLTNSERHWHLAAFHPSQVRPYPVDAHI